MGAWSHESFGNDTACDWLYGLEEEDDPGLIEDTLDTVLSAGDDDVDAGDASEAIAAAEAVARLQGNFGLRDVYSESLDEWVSKAKLKVSKALAEKAVKALDRIVTAPSELKELWEDSNNYKDWLAAVKELRGRIKV
ncbi:DUF4259 domain-containing protein [Undibacterium sp. Ji50W]|uniref:DUF4259 domain-containing protein n=1 Tax=Undibacterium sp. Ji50W TaxID=3413041 RepID=UPI003BF1CF4D